MKIASLKKFFFRRKKFGILLIQAGTNEWEPTQDELDILTDTFSTALSDPNNASILTFRKGVTAEFIPIPKEWFGKGWTVPIAISSNKRCS